MATKTRAKTRIKPIGKRERLTQLKYFLRLCFYEMEQKTGGDLKEACNLTTLSMSTMRRYANPHNATLKMEINTIQCIGIGAGYELDLIKYTVRVRAVS